VTGSPTVVFVPTKARPASSAKQFIYLKGPAVGTIVGRLAVGDEVKFVLVVDNVEVEIVLVVDNVEVEIVLVVDKVKVEFVLVVDNVEDDANELVTESVTQSKSEQDVV